MLAILFLSIADALLTLTVINLLLGSWLGTLSPVVRTFVLATLAVPIVIYGQMPHVQRLRQRLIARQR